MRRSGFQKPATQMSLFPFLAVLICTMGVLIVLLVMLVQVAQVSAEADVSDPEPDEAVRQIVTTAEDSEWLFEQLAAERDRLREAIDDRAAELAHLESHLRDLEGEARRLQEERAALVRVGREGAAQLAELESERKALEAAIADAKARVEAARRRARNAKPAYAIIPYLGPNGTHRRPIYIECRADRLIIQPEGVALTEADFGGLIGPGNPLDASLRALRDFYRQAGIPGVPYPLLIVRPEGTETYAMARAAMRSWNDEFGYELVEADRELKYPPANAALADLLAKTVERAKERQAALAAAMPAAYGRNGGGSPAFVASRSGGFVAVDQGEAAMHSRGGIGRGGGARSGMGDPTNRPARPAGSPGGPPSNARQGAATPEGASGSGAGGATGGSPTGSRGRGRDWAIREHPPGAVAITRPIRVELTHDKLVLVQEPGDARSRTKVIPLGGPLAAQVDTIVSAVWDRMESWGLAVLGGYWKPVLSVHVAPGAERRFLELQRAFRDSGVTIERRAR